MLAFPWVWLTHQPTHPLTCPWGGSQRPALLLPLKENAMPPVHCVLPNCTGSLCSIHPAFAFWRQGMARPNFSQSTTAEKESWLLAQPVNPPMQRSRKHRWGVCTFLPISGGLGLDHPTTLEPLGSTVQGGCARAISVVRAGKATTSRLPLHVRWSVGTIDGKNSLTPPHLQNDPVPPPVQWGMSRSKGDVVVVVWDMCHGH